MTLRHLLSSLHGVNIRDAVYDCSPDLDPDLPITGVTCDSRRAVAGCLFIPIRGTDFDGHNAISEAAAKGARAVFLEDRTKVHNCPLPWLLVRDTHSLLLPLCLAVHGHPERQMRLIAVTGTNGKTSLTYLLEAIFRKCGKTAVIGTVENRIGDEIIPAKHTTPPPEELAELLSRAADSGVRTVLMEASSHALDQKRLSGLTFDCGIFTNLTEDHLDYHKTAERYFLTKRSLFFHCRTKVICTDDLYGQRLAHDPALQRGMFTCSAHADAHADFAVSGLRRGDDSITSYQLDAPDTRLTVKTALPGTFAVINTALAAACAHVMYVPAPCITDGIGALTCIPGRMECIVRTPIAVYLDYAHTPDALEKALDSLACEKGSGRLSVLFGCGGEREREKRPRMAKIAAEHADRVIITSDNCRRENPFRILGDICSGIPEEKADRVTVIPDRKAAIAYLLRSALPGETVLLAGKGHETYEIQADGAHPFSEWEIVYAVMKAQNETTSGGIPSGYGI
ncbi:MAG: UDP-N-acetylmuramoyl-L-alanyl-D-glutamate--2,6-diaminopimelate ligase [Clostridia bacterium]|nr:UDP-N-acetylmuramoyl-L-alanyl-D-glutamate--2,6-diaminopimelate ligase [Clostridia bacterium]